MIDDAYDETHNVKPPRQIIYILGYKSALWAARDTERSSYFVLLDSKHGAR
jgi:hypothetical protein